MPLTEPVHSEASPAVWNGFKIVGDNIDKTSGQVIKYVIAKLRRFTIFMYVPLVIK